MISKPNPNNNAYTALELLAHTDLTNREILLGIQFLYCLKPKAPSRGSILVDGFNAAMGLREEDLDVFEQIPPVQIDSRFHDTEWDIRWRAPIIGLRSEDGIFENRHNNAMLSPWASRQVLSDRFIGRFAPNGYCE